MLGLDLDRSRLDLGDGFGYVCGLAERQDLDLDPLGLVLVVSSSDDVLGVIVVVCCCRVPVVVIVGSWS